MKNIKTIGVIAPAYIPTPEKLLPGIEYLEKKGYRVVMGKTLSSEPYGYFTAGDKIRADDINGMFADPDIDLIISARGGWGCMRLLDKLNYKLIADNPKFLVGYSDITTLQLALWHKCRLPSLSGPMVAVEMGTGILEFTEKHFWNILNKDEYQIELTETEIISKNSKKNEGILLGIDRYLAQLKLAGVFNNLNGLILGQFLDCKSDSKESFTVDEILEQYFGKAEYPVLKNIPYGHGMKKITMPIGFHTIIDGSSKTLIFKNSFNKA